jgi:hypothetical protein
MSERPKTSGQVKAIFGSAKVRGIDPGDELHDIVESVTRRTRSIADLTYAEAERVIARVKGSAFVPRRTLQYRRRKAGVKQMVQQWQLDLIVELASQRHWPSETLTQFCRRQCKRDKPLTTNEANKVIEALKAMNKREGLWAA